MLVSSALSKPVELTAMLSLESPQLQTLVANTLPYVVDQRSPLPLPVLNTFIPSIPAGFPFRVSIHCWENPRPSRHIEIMKRLGDRVLYEARVLIDGHCTA